MSSVLLSISVYVSLRAIWRIRHDIRNGNFTASSSCLTGVVTSSITGSPATDSSCTTATGCSCTTGNIPVGLTMTYRHRFRLGLLELPVV